MAPANTDCLFCKKKPWDEKELELLDWYSLQLNGRLDTRICNFHNVRQVQALPGVRKSIILEAKRRTTPIGELKRRVFMEHYRKLQADQKKSARCVLM